MQPNNRVKIINDNIHGMIRLCDTAIKIIDTPYFQRLRKLKQLGLCYLVFPGAEHTRFAHSIGTYYLAKKQMLTLKAKHPDIVSDHDVLIVSIAGLCHDLGHCTLSHTFENWINQDPTFHFHHEFMSCMIIEEIIKQDPILATRFSPEDISLIQNIIHLSDGYIIPKEKEYMFQIVCNNTTSIDVDKFDYILRDCYHTGKHYKIDINIFIESCKIINGQLCYDDKIIHDVYNLFLCRYNLFREVYYHKVLIGMQCMVLQIFDIVNEALHIRDDIKHMLDTHDWQLYLKYTDEMVTSIPFLNQYLQNPTLEPAVSIYNRILVRDIYKCVVNTTALQIRYMVGVNNPTPEHVYKYIFSRTSLSKSDVIVVFQKLNFAMQDKNPVENVLFYNKYNDTCGKTYPREYVSQMLPNIYEEIICRIYLTDNKNKTHLDDLLKLFVV